MNSINWLIFIPLVIGCGLIIKPNSELFNPASFFAVISACSGAKAYTMIKSIGKDESAYTIIFWFTLISSGIYFTIAFKELLLLDDIKYLSLIMIGVFGVIGQIGLTLSYQLSKASYVAPYSYIYILFAGLIGYYLWNELPDMLSMFGYFLITISYYYLICIQNQSLNDANQ